MSLWHGRAAAKPSTNSIELRMTDETSCCSAFTFDLLLLLLILYVVLFQGRCQCLLLGHKPCGCQTLNAPGSSANRKRGNEEEARCCVGDNLRTAAEI